MKEGSLKVVVAITEAYPTLLNAVGRMEDGLRSERLKILALMGLQVESGTAVCAAPDGEQTSDVHEVAIKGSVKFAVVLNQAQPRLYSDIEVTPPRLRAERLRSLSTLGLLWERGGKVSSPSTPASQTAVQGVKRLEPSKVENVPPASEENEPVAATLEAEPIPGASSKPEKTDSTVRDVNAVGKKVRNFAKMLGGD
jgi:hypothetical protein